MDNHSGPHRSLGEELYAERHRRGLTQTDVATMIGTSQPNYARWEIGKSRPQAQDHLRKLAEFLGWDVIDVLSLAYLPDHESPTQTLRRDVDELKGQMALVMAAIRQWLD